MVITCRRMGWTYQQYVNQPQLFLDILALMENLDNEKIAKDRAKAEAAAKKAADKRRSRG